jgi:heme A synthase
MVGRGHDLFRSVALVAVVLCYSTILLGGTVMASDDGLGCPHWPSCYPGDNFLPHVSGPAQVEWSHRVSAFFLACTVLALTALGLAYERRRRTLLGLTGLALGLVVTEALLGGLVVESRLQIALILCHLAIATALFGLLLVIALLANRREMPRRWLEWARRASEETPAAPADASLPEPAHDRSPSPFRTPGEG